MDDTAGAVAGCGGEVGWRALSKIKPLTIIAAMATITTTRFGMEFVKGNCLLRRGLLLSLARGGEMSKPMNMRVSCAFGLTAHFVSNFSLSGFYAFDQTQQRTTQVRSSIFFRAPTKPHFSSSFPSAVLPVALPYLSFNRFLSRIDPRFRKIWRFHFSPLT